MVVVSLFAGAASASASGDLTAAYQLRSFHRRLSVVSSFWFGLVWQSGERARAMGVVLRRTKPVWHVKRERIGRAARDIEPALAARCATNVMTFAVKVTATNKTYRAGPSDSRRRQKITAAPSLVDKIYAPNRSVDRLINFVLLLAILRRLKNVASFRVFRQQKQD